ncbi:MAG: NADP-dependent oxidoreductase [Bryobacteraceae bacterium]|jgi:leukotriene B4 12-hydroxydehydrogenase/15-oxo-prostaglandin 13-reductase
MSSTPSLHPSVNRQFVLASRPVGLPKESDFRIIETPVPELQEGEVLLHALYLSVDPYMRGRISGMKSYAAPTEIGGLMVGGGVAQVVESRNPGYSVGDAVEVYMGWQEFTVSNGRGLRKLDPSLAPVSTALGVLGMPGMTAYFGLLDVCTPKAGETVVVSGAAGAVGPIVGQIAKIKGCRTIGIAGGDDKINYILSECGYDSAFNYKTTDNYSTKLKELCPNGIDIYFDNVGGTITDAVFGSLNVGARIAICGQISQYNNTKVELGPRFLGALIVARAKVQGFLVSDYAARFGPALTEMAGWVKSGKIKYREDIVESFENLPKAFIGMLQGENTGKRLVKV